MRLASTLLVLTSTSAIAVAQPKPTKPVTACVPTSMSVRLTSTGGNTVGCWAEDNTNTCFALSPTVEPRAIAAQTIADVKAAVEIRDDKLCNATACKPLGKKAKAALAKYKGELDESSRLRARGTTDLKIAVFGDQAWTLASDKAIKFKAPKEYGKSGDKPSLSSIDVLGNRLISSWYNCAGPCGMSQVVDGSGTNIGPDFPSGDLVELDAKRAVSVPNESEATMTVLDVTSGKHLASLQLSKDGVLEGVGSTRVDDNTIAVTWNEFENGGHAKIVWISIPVGKAPTISATKTIPTCAN